MSEFSASIKLNQKTNRIDEPHFEQGQCHAARTLLCRRATSSFMPVTQCFESVVVVKFEVGDAPFACFYLLTLLESGQPNLGITATVNHAQLHRRLC
jgi:hypothetical protein